MSSELLQQVRVIDPVSNTDRVTDVLIADGIVQAIGDAIADSSDATEVQDCRGLVLGTGLVDLYSHSGEPGFEERETLQSLLQAASAVVLPVSPSCQIPNPRSTIRVALPGCREK
jgi:dihydroorotase